MGAQSGPRGWVSDSVSAPQARDASESGARSGLRVSGTASGANTQTDQPIAASKRAKFAGFPCDSHRRDEADSGRSTRGFERRNVEHGLVYVMPLLSRPSVRSARRKGLDWMTR